MVYDTTRSRNRVKVNAYSAKCIHTWKPFVSQTARGNRLNGNRTIASRRRRFLKSDPCATRPSLTSPRGVYTRIVKTLFVPPTTARIPKRLVPENKSLGSLAAARVYIVGTCPNSVITELQMRNTKYVYIYIHVYRT